MSWLSSFTHPGRGYDEAQKTLDKYYNEAQGYQQPYNQQGQDQYGNLQTYIDSLMHPEKLQDEWIKNYKESEAAKNAEAMANEHGADAASSMGLMGSNTALQATQAGTTQIGLEDRQNYLNDLMNKYMAGAGLTQGVYNQGASTAGQMSQTASNMGQNSADMSYGKTNAGGNILGGILGTIGGAAGTALGGAIGKKWNTTGGK